MGHDARHFFVLALPRSRTAWASVAFSVGDSYCFHDGMQGLSFAEYLTKLNSRGEPVVGDSSTGLAPHAQVLCECFPDARWLILERSQSEAREALERAAPGSVETLADGWGGLVDDFNAARDVIGERGIAMDYQDLSDWPKYAAAAQWLGVDVMDIERHATLCGLRITQILHPQSAPARPAWWAMEKFCDAGFDAEGLTSRYVTPDDLPMLDGWWRSRHESIGITGVPLPPLGVMVLLDGEPIAAVWCYESFGVGVAQISFPVTRPGTSFINARRAIAFGIVVAMSLAGQRCDPPAVFTTFHASPSPAMARTLAALGFKTDPTERVSMTITNHA